MSSARPRNLFFGRVQKFLGRKEDALCLEGTASQEAGAPSESEPHVAAVEECPQGVGPGRQSVPSLTRSGCPDGKEGNPLVPSVFPDSVFSNITNEFEPRLSPPRICSVSCLVASNSKPIWAPLTGRGKPRRDKFTMTLLSLSLNALDFPPMTSQMQNKLRVVAPGPDWT